ncbi:MAG TPA: hypothetical protein VKE69_06780, partial [Planctomycetota bacterium]|nr:hypothetical protein [Planctomycetota bacterium]
MGGAAITVALEDDGFEAACGADATDVARTAGFSGAGAVVRAPSSLRRAGKSDGHVPLISKGRGFCTR